MSLPEFHRKLIIALIVIVIFAVSAGAYVFSAAKMAQSAPVEGTDAKLTLTLDRSSYSVGDVARVTIVIQNIGRETLTIDNAEQPPILIVYDNKMNQIGTWTLYHKALPMNPPLGPITLGTGQSFSWAFQWDMTVHRTSGPISNGRLPAGPYIVQGGVSFGLSGLDLEKAQMTNVTSNVVQFQIT